MQLRIDFGVGFGALGLFGAGAMVIWPSNSLLIGWPMVLIGAAGSVWCFFIIPYIHSGHATAHAGAIRALVTRCSTFIRLQWRWLITVLAACVFASALTAAAFLANKDSALAPPYPPVQYGPDEGLRVDEAALLRTQLKDANDAVERLRSAAPKSLPSDLTKIAEQKTALESAKRDRDEKAAQIGVLNEKLLANQHELEQLKKTPSSPDNAFVPTHVRLQFWESQTQFGADPKETERENMHVAWHAFTQRVSKSCVDFGKGKQCWDSAPKNDKDDISKKTFLLVLVFDKPITYKSIRFDPIGASVPWKPIAQTDRFAVLEFYSESSDFTVDISMMP